MKEVKEALDSLKQKYIELEKKYLDDWDDFEKREKELKLKLLFFEGIANSTVDGFLVVDPNGQKILQTQRTIELWKIPQEVVEDTSGIKQVEHIMHMTVNPQKFIEEIRYQMAHPFEKRHDEVELIDGTVMERYSSPVIDAEGKNHGRIYTFHDITNRKQFEKDLVKLNRHKDHFISVLAHDLRSPLSGVLSISNILSEKLSSFTLGKIEEMIKAINVSLGKTFELLEDTLTWANASLDRIVFSPEHVNISEIISEVNDILKPLANEKNIALINKSDNNSKAFADVYMLKAVLRNLVSNAIKFTNKGGKIEVSVAENGENTIIQVEDNGIGISPETLAKLFNISSIYTSKGTADEKGTGLGLLLCKEFIEKHGGEIRIDSNVNEGTKVSFSIPLKANREL